MLSRSHSICNSLCRMPDKKHSPFIVREAWLCVLVIESCRGSNGKCYDHWRKGKETNTVPCLPQQTASPRSLSAGHKNAISAMNYCRDCSALAVRGCRCVRGCKHDHDMHINMKADVLCVCVNAFAASVLNLSARTRINSSDGSGMFSYNLQQLTLCSEHLRL